MSATEQMLIDRIRKLPPQRLAEVEGFVDFCGRVRMNSASRKPQPRLARQVSRRCGTTTKTLLTIGYNDGAFLRRCGVGAVSVHRSVGREKATRRHRFRYQKSRPDTAPAHCAFISRRGHE